MSAITRFRFARIHRPYTLALGLILPIPGVLALAYGDDVSKALSNIAAGSISRTMGAALLVGSVTTLVGVLRGRSVLEATGLLVTAAGLAIYGLGVLLGLGLQGAVGGPISLAIALGAVWRVASLSTVAREVSVNEHQD